MFTLYVSVFLCVSGFVIMNENFVQTKYSVIAIYYNTDDED